MKFLVDELPREKCILYNKGICFGPGSYTTDCPMWWKMTSMDKWHPYEGTECIWLKEIDDDKEEKA